MKQDLENSSFSLLKKNLFIQISKTMEISRQQPPSQSLNFVKQINQHSLLELREKQPGYKTESSPQSNSKSHQKQDFHFEQDFIQTLLQLQQKWILKQNQIKDYVQTLKRTIYQKNLKIEKILSEKQSLSFKISKIEEEKSYILNKLNQIHEQMILFRNEKSQKDVQQRRKSQNKSQRLAKVHTKTKLEQKQKKNANEIKSETNEAVSQSRILSQIAKIIKQINHSNESQQKLQNRQIKDFSTKKYREKRATVTTNDTFTQQPLNRNQPAEKNQFKSTCLNLIRSNPQTYQSAQTITFNNDQDRQYYNEAKPNQFYSHNEIKGSFRSFQVQSVIDTKKSNNLNLNLNLEYNWQYYGEQRAQQKQKRPSSKNKSKKKQIKLDYSLSSSLVSESDNQLSTQGFILRPLTHQKKPIKTNQPDLSQMPASSNLQFNQQAKIKAQAENQIFFQIENKNQELKFQSKERQKQSLQIQPSALCSSKSHSNALNFGLLKEATSQKQTYQFRKLQNGIKQEEISQNIPDKICQQLKSSKSSNGQNKFFKNEQKTLNYSDKKLSSISQTSQHHYSLTDQKKSKFPINTFNNKQTTGKNQQFSYVQDAKSQFFAQSCTQQDVKCNYFQQKSCSNGFYSLKSVQSDDPFKKVKLDHQNFQNHQQNHHLNKILFDNQLLKSYNKTLETQISRSNNSSKLMEKFNTQNLSILNKLKKKSIF